MSHRELELPDDSAEALTVLREASREGPVLVFKKSRICPVSTMAEGQLQSWLRRRSEGPDLGLAIVDVIARRALARGLTAELGIRHESPQALLFVEGELTWHDSHGGLVEDAFSAAIDA